MRTNSCQKRVVMNSGSLQTLSPFNSGIRTVDAPSTPQRMMQQPLKVLLQNDTRQSNHFTPNAKQLTHLLKENRTTDTRTQQLINDNQILNQQLEYARHELRSLKENQQFYVIQQRVENLEQVIDQQNNEIEEWKKKYHAAQNPAINEMESQILLVIQENERLNVLIKDIQVAIESKDLAIKTQTAQISQIESDNKKLKEKLKNQEKLLQQQKDEIQQWHDTFEDFEKQSQSNSSQDIEVMKQKMRIQELEVQLHKRKMSENLTNKLLQRKSSLETTDQEAKIRQLIDENHKISNLVQTLQDENTRLKQQSHKKNPNIKQLQILQQELIGQQLYAQEEFQRVRQLAKDKQELQNQLIKAVDLIRSLESHIQCEEPSEQLFEEYTQSQKNCIQLLDALL